MSQFSTGGQTSQAVEIVSYCTLMFHSQPATKCVYISNTHHTQQLSALPPLCSPLLLCAHRSSSASASAAVAVAAGPFGTVRSCLKRLSVRLGKGELQMKQRGWGSQKTVWAWACM